MTESERDPAQQVEAAMPGSVQLRQESEEVLRPRSGRLKIAQRFIAGTQAKFL